MAILPGWASWPLTFATLLGIPLGVIAALRRNTFVDYITLGISTIGISVPSFVLAIFLIIVLAGQLKLMKIVQQDWSQPAAWLVPAVILGFGTFAYITRLTRSTMLEVMQQDYIRTARAKGLAERTVIIRHMLRNSLIPVVTIMGPALAGLVTGSFIIEQMFSFPGSGRAYVQAIGNRDYSMIMGTTLIYAVLVVFANLTVDVDLRLPGSAHQSGRIAYDRPSNSSKPILLSTGFGRIYAFSTAALAVA